MSIPKSVMQNMMKDGAKVDMMFFILILIISRSKAKFLFFLLRLFIYFNTLPTMN